SIVLIAAEVTAPEIMKTRLQLGGAHPVRAWLNGKTVYQGTLSPESRAVPDQTGVEAELQKGVNQLVFQVTYKGDKKAIYARLLDPHRKLRYPEAAPGPGQR